jgi:hypothetical protein
MHVYKSGEDVAEIAPSLAFCRLITQVPKIQYQSHERFPLRLPFSFILLLTTTNAGAFAQSPTQRQALDLPEAPAPSSESLMASRGEGPAQPARTISTSLDGYSLFPDGYQPPVDDEAERQAAKVSDKVNVRPVELDANGNPIPLSRRQPKRILGFMPNFRSVSGGAVAPPPTWGHNFHVATRQSFDYSSFIFLGITSLSAQAINAHPSLGTGPSATWAYTWRGFLDKTNGTYLGAFLMPSLLREDTRYFAMGNERSIPIRILYVMSRQVVARTYHGHQTPNIAGLSAKILTQIISRTYYPAGSTDFGVLATKFGYATMRDISFTAVREFYPDIAGHVVRVHKEKLLRQQQAQLQQIKQSE